MKVLRCNCNLGGTRFGLPGPRQPRGTPLDSPTPPERAWVTSLYMSHSMPEEHGCDLLLSRHKGEIISGVISPDNGKMRKDLRGVLPDTGILYVEKEDVSPTMYQGDEDEIEALNWR